MCTHVHMYLLNGNLCLPQGNLGFKRFLRDGHHTVRENKKRKYYDPEELKVSNGRTDRERDRQRERQKEGQTDIGTGPEKQTDSV